MVNPTFSPTMSSFGAPAPNALRLTDVEEIFLDSMHELEEQEDQDKSHLSIAKRA